MIIRFSYKDNTIRIPKPHRIKQILTQVATDHSIKVNLIYIFVGLDEIVRLNQFYLDHDYATDILSFENSKTNEVVQATFYVCLSYTKEYALENGLEFHIEAYRVLIHGLLHILGYEDTDNNLTIQMRAIEDKYLNLLL